MRTCGEEFGSAHARAALSTQVPNTTTMTMPGVIRLNDFAVGMLLAVLAPDATSKQRVPAIEGLNILRDMGRATHVIAIGRNSWHFALACVRASALWRS